MDEAELQALLDSGNPEDIDKALKHLAEIKEDVTAEPSSGKQGAEQTAAVEGTDVSTVSSTANNAAPKGVASKNGDHVLPYEVLEQERREKAELKRQLEESDRRYQASQTMAQQVEATNQKVELLTNQLTKLGIKPAQLAEELQLTEAELEGLEDYDQLGEVSAKVARKVMALEAQLTKLTNLQQTAAPKAAAAEPAAEANAALTDVHAAIDATEGMRAVMSDPVLTKQAVALDEKLKAMPEFADKPLTARFAEVMKRMAPVILQQQGKSGKQADVDFDDVKPPHSLNGIAGATADVNATLTQQLEGLTEEQIQHRISQMTDAQLKQLHAETGW